MTANSRSDISRSRITDAEMLDALFAETLTYFLQETHPRTGLTADRNEPGAPASIAATGLALAAFAAAADAGLIRRRNAARKVLRTLRFLRSAPQGRGSDMTGYQGFYYHFLSKNSGRRRGRCELSTIDTAILIAGALTAACYFSADDPAEREIRKYADILYRRVNWQWALNGGDTLSHGWKPETGFLESRWDSGYSEALILYTLAAGSPTFPIGRREYESWTSSFEIRHAYGYRYIYAGPLFIHQLSHVWIDFRGIRDRVCRRARLDFFENSRRATMIQRQYGIHNPQGFRGYGANGWGLTASDGPGPAIRRIKGACREFFGYKARGAPFGPDDGTISPWAVTASLPFAPELVLKTVRHQIEQLELKRRTEYGFDASFNPTFPRKSRNKHGWVSRWIFGLNQGPIILMIANYRSELIWRLMRDCPYVRRGLHRLGFTGGWLSKR